MSAKIASASFMSRACGLVCLMIAGVPASHVSAQTPPLTTTDSARIRIAVMARVLEDLGPDEPPPRIWVRNGNRVTAGPARNDVSISPEQWTAISDTFPNARPASALDTVFLCPPGVRLMLPGTGCPIREDGVVIMISPIVQDADSVVVRGGIARSSPGGRSGHVSWAAAFWIIFEHADGAWRIRRVGPTAVT